MEIARLRVDILGSGHRRGSACGAYRKLSTRDSQECRGQWNAKIYKIVGTTLMQWNKTESCVPVG